MQGVPHVPPAQSSDDEEEQEPEEDIQAADLSQEQLQQQAQPVGHTAEGTTAAQVKLSWVAPLRTQRNVHVGIT